MTFAASVFLRTLSARRSVLGAAGLALILSACSGMEADHGAGWMTGGRSDVALIDGRMVLPEGADIPSTARAEARLVDLDRSGAEGDFLVASSVADAVAAPVPFRLQWRPGTLPEEHRYVVSARLIGRSGVLYTTEVPVRVATMRDRQEVTLVLVPTGVDLEDEVAPSYSVEDVPDPSGTAGCP